ncbi:hypothetical protein [Candidatus Methanoperedens sp. BLZ2]|nr:hypothetical protein [Candidatus Methanoperedens sp. BLZ2]
MIQCEDCKVFFFLKESLDEHPCIGYVALDDPIRKSLEWREAHQ